ncbi:transposase family protein [Streptomyces ferralitis]|uniref:Transposase family protein n=1 Tax=Streptantibioticus ferralitis TaxID=236510 RepID=A0ABT5YU68_9ACTN|nr:transposase family protein [Streptantibioticus ferralitis]MDF2255161.1 transposase family protein [Streptantibioticus ferralitis]
MHEGLTVLTDLGYENAADGLRHPVKKPKGGELAESDQACNAVIRGVHAVAERANALLKVTFKALRRPFDILSPLRRKSRGRSLLQAPHHFRTTHGGRHRHARSVQQPAGAGTHLKTSMASTPWYRKGDPTYLCMTDSPSPRSP